MRVADGTHPEDKRRFYTWEAGSWSDLLEFAETRTRHSTREASRHGEPPDWSGTPTFEAAMTLARDGWKEGADKIKPLAEQLSVGLARMVQRDVWTYDVAGDAFDVAMMLAGEPEYWIRPEPTIYDETHRGSVVRILVNGSVDCRVQPDTVTRFGIAAGALITTLAVAGIEAQVDLSFCGTGCEWSGDSNEVWRAVTTLKRAGDVLDIHRLAFATAHVSMFRRVMFSVWESHPRFDAALGENYGRPAPDPMADRYDLTLTAGEYHGTTQDDAQRWVIEQAKALGVHFTAEAEAGAQVQQVPVPQVPVPRRRVGGRRRRY